jgi:tRNA(adenine34) deaminase
MTDQTQFKSMDYGWMRHALLLARRAYDEGEVPVGAVVVYDGNIVGEGWNRSIGLNDPSAHAEIQALRDAGQHLKNYRLPACKMYVTLEPCAMCVSAIIHARLYQLIYAAPDPKTGALGGAYDLPGVHPHNHEFEQVGGLLADESSEMLKAFFRERRIPQPD